MMNRPNLLFVFADQLGMHHCGYAGATAARTPNIDRFATQGINFCDAVASSPVCAAFRASLMTGKYTTSTGMVINELRMNTAHRCLGHVVTDAGYRTCYIGKWHLYANELGKHYEASNSFVPPGPDRLGFEGHFAAYNFHHNYYDVYYHLDTPQKISYGQGVYEPDAQTDMMIDWLREQTDAEQPFCAFLSYGTPHDPWNDDNVPAEFRAMFDGVDFPHPPNYSPDNDPYGEPTWHHLNAEQREQLPGWRRNYYAMTANLDWNFGRLVKAIDRLGLADNTIVVFASDHGEMFGSQGRRAKNIFYEEAARVPLLIRWPGAIAAGSTSNASISSVDYMPTLLGLLGLPIPDEVEGMDCSHIARGRAGDEPDAAFLQNTGSVAAWADGYEWRALRDRQYTYAIYRRDGRELLFDHTADPCQMNDLARAGGHEAELQCFGRMLTDKMASINDTFETCTWYREHWIENRCIVTTATLNV